MTIHMRASSISRPVSENWAQRPWHAQVLAVFAQACDLLTQDGRVIALVTPALGNGPLNVVVDAMPESFRGLQPGMPARIEERVLTVGGLQVALDTAVVWEPRPDWPELRARREACCARLPLVQSLALRLASADSLVGLVAAPPGDDSGTLPGPLSPVSGAMQAMVQEALALLRAGWKGDTSSLQAGAAQLAGLGGGLTPAGDDLLCGVMLWAWLAHPDPAWLCQLVAGAAAPRTTTLSAAFLQAAARGECSAAWHTLLGALSGGTEEAIAASVDAVLSYGATSGADTLAGFVWAGLLA